MQEIEPRLEQVLQGLRLHPLKIAKFPVKLPITNCVNKTKMMMRKIVGKINM